MHNCVIYNMVYIFKATCKLLFGLGTISLCPITGPMEGVICILSLPKGQTATGVHDRCIDE